MLRAWGVDASHDIGDARRRGFLLTIGVHEVDQVVDLARPGRIELLAEAETLGGLGDRPLLLEFRLGQSQHVSCLLGVHVLEHRDLSMRLGLLHDVDTEEPGVFGRVFRGWDRIGLFRLD